MKEMKMYQQHPCCEEKEGAHLYKIGMFANMNRVTIKTLRYYDEQNLLTPVYVDEEVCIKTPCAGYGGLVAAVSYTWSLFYHSEAASPVVTVSMQSSYENDTMNIAKLPLL